MRILINVPDLSLPGGVVALFRILKMEQYYINVSLFILHNSLPSIVRLPIKYIEFIFKILKVDLVHLNPSLNRKSFLRDALFAWLAILFSKKLIIYWHGWEENYEERIKGNVFLIFIAKHTFFKAHASIVLGSLFQKKLIVLGYKNKIYIETNTADNQYIETGIIKEVKENEPIRLLFISRLEIEKGIYIAIETLKILNREKSIYKLIVAGSGNEEKKIQQLAQENPDIEWAGLVDGLQKHNLLFSAHFMFFPTYYPEGLPLTLLEGIMYGLPLITRPVGGIPDIVVNGENGFLIKSLSPEEYAEKISHLVVNSDLFKQISTNNIKKSELFTPEKVRERIYNIYLNVLTT